MHSPPKEGVDFIKVYFRREPTTNLLKILYQPNPKEFSSQRCEQTRNQDLFKFY